MKTRQLNIRLSDIGWSNLDMICQASGLNQTAAVEIALAALKSGLTKRDTKMENTGNGTKVNRKEAIELVGLEAVENVESLNCEWSSGGGQAFGEYDTTQTWKATESLNDNTYDYIDAIYYVEDKEFIDSNGVAIEDLSNIDWEIDHYVLY